MIRYTLACDQGHEFESWFADSQAYDAQAAAGFVSCPQCGSLKVGKTVMAPALARSAVHDRSVATEAPPVPAGPAQQAQQAASLPDAMSDEAARRVRAVMRAVRHYVVQNTVDVGAQFPDEARRIHSGEAEARAIRGEARPEEVRALLEEGVDIMPLPSLPDDLN
ncbi:hypothetical protein GCM10019059_13730 [Camelimonas fluminis]|uniref:DUF1178 family protein n=1 Tax=Camelimonas fluminis TaxID=1576911 RepID=A0ABV7UM98_9HYPH|nr:DUF1178 family protein [Camelimonas fluminis]GHE55546.1 hypothetical protein GCM10019059_13730 [Camelimonas fluminis]